ncbi:hypothetical protein [Streptomyces sp. B6B3]|uniref:hypothetical protein n=1 Tax=Streptomyces sp. B6B3 TaxID=3153570 RepID=UPI00325D6B9C
MTSRPAKGNKSVQDSCGAGRVGLETVRAAEPAAAHYPTDALSQEQQTQLTAWLAQRNARVAAHNHCPPLQDNLADRLRTLDAAFARRPDRDHELRRTVEIYEGALRQ